MASSPARSRARDWSTPKAGGDADKLWDALYLRPAELIEFLKFTEDNANRDWLHPFLVTAAYTGARRSELIRMRTEDVNLDEGTLMIREKKRAQGTRTSRHVPICRMVAEVLKPLLTDRVYLFGNGDSPITVADTQKAWYGTYKGSKWQVVRGYHVCRHSFISACASKGIDQRMLQAWCGHMSPEMSRRYTHLYPSTQAAALSSVFG